MEGVPVLFCDEPWYCVCDPPSIIVAKLPFMVDAENLYRFVGTDLWLGKMSVVYIFSKDGNSGH